MLLHIYLTGCQLATRSLTLEAQGRGKGKCRDRPSQAQGRGVRAVERSSGRELSGLEERVVQEGEAS